LKDDLRWDFPSGKRENAATGPHLAGGPYLSMGPHPSMVLQSVTDFYSSTEFNEDIEMREAFSSIEAFSALRQRSKEAKVSFYLSTTRQQHQRNMFQQIVQRDIAINEIQNHNSVSGPCDGSLS
jgi:hypothetical protein